MRFYLQLDVSICATAHYYLLLIASDLYGVQICVSPRIKWMLCTCSVTRVSKWSCSILMFYYIRDIPVDDVKTKIRLVFGGLAFEIRWQPHEFDVKSAQILNYCVYIAQKEWMGSSLWMSAFYLCFTLNVGHWNLCKFFFV